MRFSWYILLFAAIVLLFNHFFAYFGHYGWDDMIYAKLAHSVADGTYHLGNDHYAYRIGIVGLLGVCYKLFGISDHTSAILPMAATLLTMAMLLRVVRTASRWEQVLAAALFLLHSWTLFYADKIMPDCLVALGAIVSIAALYLHRFEAQTSAAHSLRAALALVAGLSFAWMSKETIWLVAPIIGYVFLTDILLKRHGRFWVYALSIGFGLLLLMGVGYWMTTGNPLARFAAIRANSYHNPCSYDELPFAETLHRIGTQLWRVFVESGQMLALGLAAIGFAAGIWRERLGWLRLHSPEAFWSVSAVVGIFSANFLTISPTAYVPMCPDPRHFLWLSPLLAIAAAPVAKRLWMEKQYVLAAGIGLAICCYVVPATSDIFQYMYLPMLLLVVLRGILPLTMPRINHVLPVVCVAIMGLILVLQVKTAKSMGYRHQKKMVEEVFKPNKTEKIVVITNPVQKHFGEYYLAYDSTHTHFLSYEQAENYSMKGDERILIMQNWYTENFSGITDASKFPEYVRNKPEAIRLLREENGVSLYEIPMTWWLQFRQNK